VPGAGSSSAIVRQDWRQPSSASPPKETNCCLRMALTNRSKTATTVTLHFPVLRALRMDAAADTWYLCGKRGGIINVADAAFREPLGERHALQMTGSSSQDRSGAGLPHA